SQHQPASIPGKALPVKAPLRLKGPKQAALHHEEYKETLTDLLALLIELHAMPHMAGVLPTPRVTENLALFCLRAQLTDEFQVHFRQIASRRRSGMPASCEGLDHCPSDDIWLHVVSGRLQDHLQ